MPLDERCLKSALNTAEAEVRRATAKWPPFNSAHEGFAVLKEEVDELWEQIKYRQDRRDLDLMKREAIQVAAMAIRFVHDIIDGGRGRQ